MGKKTDNIIKSFAKEVRKKIPKSKIYLFGSRVKGKAKKNSDYDFLIVSDDFKNSNFDMAILGEGEQTTSELINQYNQDKFKNKEFLKKINGILFRNNNKIIKTKPREFIKDLDQIPFPARELLNMKFYNQARITPKRELKTIGSMMTSRGCPFNCSFCSTSLFWKYSVRFHSPEYVIKEIK